MPSRRLRRWSTWLLPLLVARLLVPVGFMVSVSGGGIALTLCPSYASLPGPAPAVSAHPDHAGMEHGAHAPPADTGVQSDTPGSGGLEHGNPSCPFALSPGGAPWPVVKAVAEPPRFVTTLPGLSADPAWTSPAVLIDRIRGPPRA